MIPCDRIQAAICAGSKNPHYPVLVSLHLTTEINLLVREVAREMGAYNVYDATHDMHHALYCKINRVAIDADDWYIANEAPASKLATATGRQRAKYPHLFQEAKS